MMKRSWTFQLSRKMVYTSSVSFFWCWWFFFPGGGVGGCLDYEHIYLSLGKADGKEQKSQEKAVAAPSKSSLVSKKSKDDDDSDEDETDDSDEDDTDDSDVGEGLSPEEGDDDVSGRMEKWFVCTLGLFHID
jgi:hypothetical protein